MPASAKLIVKIDANLLDELRAIAAREGRQLEAAFEEALRDLVERRKRPAPRSEILVAFGESLAEFGPLYRRLAK